MPLVLDHRLRAARFCLTVPTRVILEEADWLSGLHPQFAPEFGPPLDPERQMNTALHVLLSRALVSNISEVAIAARAFRLIFPNASEAFLARPWLAGKFTYEHARIVLMGLCTDETEKRTFAVALAHRMTVAAAVEPFFEGLYDAEGIRQAFLESGLVLTYSENEGGFHVR